MAAKKEQHSIYKQGKQDETSRRFVSIWFRHLHTDWFALSEPGLKHIPFVLRTPSHGRMIITGINDCAAHKGITTGMVLADARAILPNLEVKDDNHELNEKLLRKLAEWCIRFSPVVAVDAPDGLLLDVTGCTHLWGGDEAYVADITKKLQARGYEVRVSIAETAGVAWGVARYGKNPTVIPSGKGIEALLPLPPEALRLEPETCERLHKLGLHTVAHFLNMPRPSLRRRFGESILQKLDMATGFVEEPLEPVIPPAAYEERLPCMEPIVTASGIEYALQELLTRMCLRLERDQKGLRSAVLKCFRVDGKTELIEVATNRPSCHGKHLFKLFEIKIPKIDPGLGIELFILEAPLVEDYFSGQARIWESSGGLEDIRLSELLDRIMIRCGDDSVRRFLPSEHFWPERSFSKSGSLNEQPVTYWRKDRIRPLVMFNPPEKIEVTAPIPDYPPMLFRHKGKLHKIVRADGPERIEQEWWLQQGQHRDYYRVEDEEGNRYWIFRSGHYDDRVFQWYLHGCFG